MNHADAEDISQDTLLLIHLRYPHLDSESNLVPLAIRIAGFKCRERRRGTWRRSEWPEEYEPATDELLPDEQLDRDRWLNWMKSSLHNLGARCLRIFELQLQGKTTAEIAAALAITENNLHVAALRCRRRALELAPSGARP
jgi:RNA polymerase sigma factor (sigma-70 family)